VAARTAQKKQAGARRLEAAGVECVADSTAFRMALNTVKFFFLSEAFVTRTGHFGS
jgi:hypothetical protein